MKILCMDPIGWTRRLLESLWHDNQWQLVPGKDFVRKSCEATMWESFSSATGPEPKISDECYSVVTNQRILDEMQG